MQTAIECLKLQLESSKNSTNNNFHIHETGRNGARLDFSFSSNSLIDTTIHTSSLSPLLIWGDPRQGFSISPRGDSSFSFKEETNAIKNKLETRKKRKNQSENIIKDIEQSFTFK